MKRLASYTFVALIRKEADSRYSVRFPQLDGFFTEGDSFEEALRSAEDALSLHLQGMTHDGEDFEAEEGEMAVLVTASVTPHRNKAENRAVKKTLTIPAWLNAAAEKRGINFSQTLQNALMDYLGINRP